MVKEITVLNCESEKTNVSSLAYSYISLHFSVLSVCRVYSAIP